MKAIRDASVDASTGISEYVQKAKDNPKKSHHTVRERKRALDYFQDYIIQVFDVGKINEIHPDHIVEYRDQRRQDGVSDVTINGEISSIRGLCNYYNHTEFLVQFEITDLNLDTSTTVQKSSETPSLSVDQYLKIIDECENMREELIVKVGWETGIRRSEAENIDIDDIEQEEIHIESAKENQNYRTVYLRYDTASKIQQYIQTDRKSYAGSSSSDALFVSERGRLTAHSINEIFKKKCEQADVQKIIGENAKGDNLNLYTYHSLRHSFAIQRLQNNINLKYLADLMGNTVETVSDTYLQTTSEERKQANRESRPDIHY